MDSQPQNLQPQSTLPPQEAAPETVERVITQEPAQAQQEAQPEIPKPEAEVNPDVIKPATVKAVVWEEILAKGYDAVDFAQFLANYQREVGPSNGAWTQVTLREAIAKFKETHSPEFDNQVMMTSSVAFKPTEQQKDNFAPPQSTEEDVKDQEPVRRKTLDVTAAQEKIFINKLEPSVLNGQDVHIKIDEAKVSKGGMFSGVDHVRFTIKTQPMGWVVDRKHNDFSRLQIALDKLFPGLAIPKIAKKSDKEKFGDESIRKRMYVYEKFLQYCVKSEDIKATKFFIDFLSVDDRKKFTTIKKAAQSLPTINRIQELANTTGETPIDTTPEKANYAMLVETYHVQADPIFKDIKNLGKKLAAELAQVSATLNEISNRYNVLHNISSGFNGKAINGKDKLENVFFELHTMLQQWGNSVQSQSNSVKKNLVCFYKYSCYEINAFKTMNQNRLKLQCEYEKFQKDLYAKKEKLFATGDFTKWDMDQSKIRNVPKDDLKIKEIAFDLMLTKDNLQLGQYKDSYGFSNYAAYSQMMKNFENQHEAYKENFGEFLSKNVELNSHLNITCDSILESMRGVQVPAN